MALVDLVLWSTTIRYDAILEWMEIDGWPVVVGGEGVWLSPINELLYSLLDYIMYYATD